MLRRRQSPDAFLIAPGSSAICKNKQIKCNSIDGFFALVDFFYDAQVEGTLIHIDGLEDFFSLSTVVK